MKRFMIRRRKMVTILLLVAFSARCVTPTYAESPVKLTNWDGTIDFSTAGPSSFTLEGTASHLGRFTAYGEVEFLPAETRGSLVGEGVAVFTAANGDQLVAGVTWDVDGDHVGPIHFSWRDSVEFSDGSVKFSTGRFVDSRPPGLVVIAIIAILIGLLLPAVQKVR